MTVELHRARKVHLCHRGHVIPRGALYGLVDGKPECRKCVKKALAKTGAFTPKK